MGGHWLLQVVTQSRDTVPRLLGYKLLELMEFLQNFGTSKGQACAR